MPERDRLASNLFQVAPLRSPTGLAVPHDMMTLYQKRSEVEYRPGLEPDKCCCRKDDPSSALTRPMTGDIYTHAIRGTAAMSMTFPSSAFSVMSGVLVPKPGTTTAKIV